MKKITAIIMALVLALSLTTVSLAQEGTAPRVAVVLADKLGDLSFYDGANEGLQRLISDYKVTGSGIVECLNDPTKWEPLLIKAAQENDIVVAVGWEFWSALESVAPDLPDTKFIFVDNGLEGIANVLSIVYADNEGSFLAGYAAMKLATNTNTVGFVGGEDCDTINNFYIGYKAGAEYANPEGVVLAPSFVGDYEDSGKGKECAMLLYGNKAEVVFHAASKAGLGVFEAAKEQGKYAIGVDCDQKYLDPEHIVASVVKNVGGSIYDVIAQYIEDGTFEGGQVLTCDLAGGYETLGYGAEDATQQISDEIKGEIDLLAQQIANGEIVVPSAFDVE